MLGIAIGCSPGHSTFIVLGTRKPTIHLRSIDYLLSPSSQVVNDSALVVRARSDAQAHRYDVMVKQPRCLNQ